MKTKKVVVAVVTLMFVAAVSFLVAKHLQKDSGQGSQFRRRRAQGPVAVQIASPSIRSISDEREFTGTVKASYKYVASAKVNGRLVSLKKRIGDLVGRNEVIGRIDGTEYRHSLREAQAQIRVSNASVAEAQAQHSFTERELERVEGLLEKGIASRVEYESLQTQLQSQKSKYELAQAQLAQRQALLAQAKTRLGYTNIRASKPGYIAMRHVDGGAQLSVGSSVVTIVGIDTVFVEVAATEDDYQRLSSGKKAEVKVDAIPGKRFEGSVHRVAPFFDNSSRTAAVEVALHNDSLLLKPGMFARLSVVLEKKDSALVVPSSAIVDRNGKFSVFTLIDSAKVKQVPVSVGIDNGAFAQINSPAEINAPVVTLGHHLLRDGGKVIVSSGSSQESGEPKSKKGSAR
ncbi:MAG: efflux RND transporter periplasmic adaptor subunit [Chitinispirillaceae bacterium]